MQRSTLTRPGLRGEVAALFKPISQTRIAQRIVEQILELIREGKLKVGEKLPGENTLAAEFQVSRPCIREALRILEAVGIVEVRRGKGCYVLSSPDGVDSASIWLSWLATFRYEVLALLEVREALEGKVAALAAQRASEVDMAEMEAVLVRTRESLEAGVLGPDEAYTLDLQFHRTLARASGNPFLMRLSNSVGGAMEADRRATMVIPNRIRASLEDHQAIFEAVRRRDPDGARNAMARHVQAVARDIGTARLQLRA
ncbi:MAG TPA: FadR family transcriptional regulator [Firmicutes bacterium]|nr:FadR family transcriptional regulator [Bacillota bacterium]